MTSLVHAWSQAFYQTLEADRVASAALREAALGGVLGEWTKLLTEVVVTSLTKSGMQAASKGFPGETLPIRRSEYLALDVVAFRNDNSGWQFPAVVCELENSPRDDLVEYALWKVLCVRAGLRIVFCYRRQPERGNTLVGQLYQAVLGSRTVAERGSIGGETLLVVGTTNDAVTFPYGFFRAYKLETNVGRFAPYQRGRS